MRLWEWLHLSEEQLLSITCAGHSSIGRHCMLKKDLELERGWQWLLDEVSRQMGERPKDLNGMLFLVGVQELGKGKQKFTKEQKQDLMHIAICRVLSLSGFYVLEGSDSD